MTFAPVIVASEDRRTLAPISASTSAQALLLKCLLNSFCDADHAV